MSDPQFPDDEIDVDPVPNPDGETLTPNERDDATHDDDREVVSDSDPEIQQLEEDPA